MAKFDKVKAARVLVDAHFDTDDAAAKKHGVTVRTVTNYRFRATPGHKQYDADFSEYFRSLMDEVATDEKWDWMTDAVHAGVRACMECFRELDKKNPETLRTIRETVEMLTSYELTKKVIEAEIEAATATNPKRATAGAKGASPVHAFA